MSGSPQDSSSPRSGTTPLPSAFERLVGTRLGEYEIQRLVGHGSMGVVFEAWHGTLGRRVALKVLPPSLGTSDRSIQRFLREAQAVAQLHHENIVPIYEVGEVNAVHFYAMQFIDGTPLDQELRQHGALPPREAARIVCTAARAMHFAHQRGIIHRDIKPANIIRMPDGKIIVTDFGLARPERGAALTDSGAMVGTPLYMSPEQVRGRRDEVDRKTDVYSLGATLYELATGRAPFAGTSTQEILQSILEDEPRALRAVNRVVPMDLEVITLKALEKNPKRRYDSALELAQDLERFLEGEPVLARRSGMLTKVMKRVRKHRTISSLVLVVVLLTAAILGGVFSVEQGRQSRELDQALLAAQTAYDDLAFAAALDSYGRALEMRPDHPAALLGHALASFKLASTWLQNEERAPANWRDEYGSPEKLLTSALPEVEEVLRSETENSMAHLCRAELHFSLSSLRSGAREPTPEELELQALAAADLNEADRLSRDSTSSSAWRTQQEIAELRLDMAANPELRRADKNQFLQGALENATHAIALHQSSLAAAGRADHRATGYLAKLFSLRARVYRDLYGNSDVLDEQSGQRSGQVIYLERCLSDAEQSLRYWDDPTNPATTMKNFAESALGDLTAAQPRPTGTDYLSRKPTQKSDSRGLGSVLEGLRYFVTPETSERTKIFSQLVDDLASQGAAGLRGLQSAASALLVDPGDPLTTAETREQAMENFEKAQAMVLAVRVQGAQAAGVRFDEEQRRDQEQKLTQAKQLIASAIDLIPHNPDFHHEMSYVCLVLEDADAAKEHARRAAELAPTNPLYLESLCGVLLEIAELEESASLRSELAGEAAAVARQLLELYPGAKKFERLLERALAAGEGAP